MVDITRTSVLRHEFERALRRLPAKAAKRIKKLLEVGLIGDDTILEAQHIITQELGAKEAHKVLNRYSMLFWKRGSDFARRQLKHTELILTSAVSASATTGAAIRRLKHVGLTLEIPSYLAVTDGESLTALRAMQFDLVKGMSNDMKKDVAFQMREGLLRGEHPTKIANRIGQVARITKNKATRIARTEATRVFNEAAGDRYKKAGVEKFRWDAIGDERTCDICGELNGKIFKMDELKPPAHPNCRCTITPVIEKPKEEVIPAIKKTEDAKIADDLWKETAKDGKEHGFVINKEFKKAVGDGDSVQLSGLLPKGTKYKAYHTHPDWDCPLSPSDIGNLLYSKDRTQTTAITKKYLYKLTKTSKTPNVEFGEFAKILKRAEQESDSLFRAGQHRASNLKLLQKKSMLKAGQDIAKDYNLVYEVILR